MQSTLVVRRADGANTSSAKRFSEDLAPAQDCVAAKAAGNHHELNDTSRQRQIGHAAAVMTVHASGNRFA